MAKRYYCNCCGTNFPEPDGVFEKLRCPVCDAVREEDNEGDDVFIEEIEEGDFV